MATAGSGFSAPAPALCPASCPRIDLLGPLTLRVGGERIEVGAPMLRRLLGLLALRANRPVTQSGIVDFLWGEDIPPTYRNLIHTYVSRLRRLLGPDGTGGRLIRRDGNGYRLIVTAGQCDALEFTTRLADAAAYREAGRSETAEEEYRKALSLWQAPAMADLTPEIHQDPGVVALTRQRLGAALDYADLAFAHDHHQAALARLQEVVEVDPLHEGINARIMLALAATGQRRAAIHLFREISGRLGENLGVDPGTELRDAYLRCLGSSSAAPSRNEPSRTPEQLPPDSTAFVGRLPQLEALDAALPGIDRSRRAANVLVVTGTAGVGKTTLAIHWAHRVSHRFPDGQLYYNLNGFSDAVTRSAGDALTAFLTGLGVGSTAVPVDVEARAALLRSVLADREVLLVLDNVTGPEQVHPLLPSNPGSVVVVTSRNDLSGLALHTDARFIELDVLDQTDAVGLLARLLQSPASSALEELSELCARLPLALRIAAANLGRGVHDSLNGYVTALRAGNRLAGLTLGAHDGVAVQAAFELSYATLGPDTSRLFRLLGLVPTADVSVAALAALADTTVENASRVLDRLVGAHLVQRRTADRYQVHDLLRLYAAQLCAEVDSEADRRQAGRRLSLHYLNTAREATGRAYPGMLRLCALPEKPALTEDLVSEPAEWLAVERGNLTASVLHAADHGPRELAWQLTEVLRGYLWRNYDVATWRDMAQAALTAARREGDRSAEAAMHYSLGAAHRSSGLDPLAAKRHLRRAERMFRELKMPTGRAAALDCLGTVLHLGGESRQAIAVLEQAVELCEEADFTLGRAKALCTLGFVSADVGLTDVARERLLEALELSEELEDRHLEALALHNLSRTHHHAHRYDEAMTGFRRALAIRTEIKDTEGRAATLDALGLLSLAAGSETTARRYWQEALDAFQRLGHPAADGIRSRLDRSTAGASPFVAPATISAMP